MQGKPFMGSVKQIGDIGTLHVMKHAESFSFRAKMKREMGEQQWHNGSLTFVAVTILCKALRFNEKH